MTTPEIIWNKEPQTLEQLYAATRPTHLVVVYNGMFWSAVAMGFKPMKGDSPDEAIRNLLERKDDEKSKRVSRA